MVDVAEQRANMVESQIRPSDVADRRILSAMQEIPREHFVPPELVSLAYMDEDVPLNTSAQGAESRWLMAPRVLAKLLQLADIGEDDRVLDVGVGTGYSAALLGKIASSVIALESDAGLANEVTKTLKGLAIDNVDVVTGDLAAGCPDHAPFDVVILGGAIDVPPEALGSAYAYNPRLDAQRAFLRARDEDVSIAMSGYRPQVGVEGDYGVRSRHTRPTGTLGGIGGGLGANDGVTQPAGWTVFGEQNIFRGFRTYNAVNRAEADVRAEREIYRDVERNILLEAVTAYMDVVRDIEVVRLAENNVNVLSRELKATQDRFSVGEVTRTDVAQAEARRADAVSDLESARANLRTSRGAFLQVIGNPPNDLFDPGPPDQFLPGSLEEAINVSNNENPLVVASLYREQAAGYRVKEIHGELLPTVTLEGGYTQRFNTDRFIDKDESTEVLGRLTIPLYQGGEVSARVRQAKHDQVGFLQQIEQARTEQAQEVVAAWAQLEKSRAQLKSDTISVESNRVALQGVREEEKVGQRTILDVLDAEQEYVEAEVDLERTKRNLVVAGYAVLSAMGRLDAAWIGVAANVYDPQVHYHEVRRKWFGLSITHGDGHHETFEASDPGYAPAK